jgi:hypothetical protein
MEMRRYWIELKDMSASVSRFGITAYSADDALGLLAEYLRRFYREEAPVDVRRIIENIDISSLDADHVLPNMLPTVYRGVWYPMG